MAGRTRMSSSEKRARVLLGREIRKRLIDMNMTETELGKKIGISPQGMSRIIRGTTPGHIHMQKIAKILKIDLEKLTA